MMANLACASYGAQVLTPTTFDPDFPVTNIIDGQEDTFWITSGMYPQEFKLEFQNPMPVQAVKILCANGRKIVIEGSEDSLQKEWRELCTLELADTEGRPQLETVNVSRKGIFARVLRVRIESGWDDFTTVHQLIVEGVEE